MKLHLQTSLTIGLLAAATFVACKDDTTVNEDGTSDAALSACKDQYAAYLAYYDKCYPNASGDTRALRDYEDTAIKSCAIQLALPGVSAGLLDAYKSCSDEVKNAACTTDLDDLCTGVQKQTGTLAAGAACEADEQCVSGGCGYQSSSGTSEDGGASHVVTASDYCGTCNTVVAIGADCSSQNVTCATGSHCEPSYADGNSSTTCVADAKLGDTCDYACSGDSDLACIDGTCKAAPGKGAACTFQCASGLSCIDAVCTEPLAKGATCEPDSDYCGAALTCDLATLKCVDTPAATAKIGQPCNDQDATKACAEGYCSGATYTSDGSGTHVVDGTCKAYAKVGEACNANSSDGAYCEPFLDCLDAKCTEPGRRCTY